ncbi:phosphotransferase [Pseudoalteromonas luteoviolacea]|uniref:phosphotransferase n=1 Tax=Pseudoalteromonas luteoviolacea TaxID=43657 RepID=UPI0009BDA0C5|nr:phosphotransferase [Pseudoalteromonas luteoviolacea]
MLAPPVIDWLEQTLQQHNLQCTPVTGGANNLGVKIEAGGQTWFLKCFEATHLNTRQKQLNEFMFSQAIYNAGTLATPKPIAINATHNVSLFEYIAGSKVEQATSSAITAAISFVKSINSSAPKQALNIASESADSLLGFADIVKNRLAKFSHTRLDNAQLYCELQLTLNNIRDRYNTVTQEIPTHWTKKIDQNVVSPSDFGFHNAISRDNQFYFIDFEYAGMDTAWKLFADFFSQPAVPVDIAYANKFLSLAIFQPLKLNPQDTLKVFELTLLKWCLIMLNEFLPDVQARRIFSWNISCINEQKRMLDNVQRAQLHKCNAYFKEIPLKVMGLSETLREIT